MDTSEKNSVFGKTPLTSLSGVFYVPYSKFGTVIATEDLVFKKNACIFAIQENLIAKLDNFKT